MRARLKKSEMRKALELVERAVFAMKPCNRGVVSMPEFIGAGVYNSVFGLTADLVVRVCRYISPDQSWAYYDWVQENGKHFEACPQVWHLDSFGGHRFAIVERMQQTIRWTNKPVDRGNLTSMLHKLENDGYFYDDLHSDNIMLSRRGRVVCTDMHMYPPEHC